MRLAIAVCSVVILVSSSGGCDTSRDWAQIQAAAQAQADTVSNDNTLSLPPGYISGFEVTLRKDYTVLITGGSANVGGRQVTLSEDHQLTLQDWVAPRMDTPQHYYLYLSKDGNIYVDIVKPKFDSYYGYYQQPATGWRAIGKMFVQSNNIIYAIKDAGRSGRTVTVAPADYVGYADYYCDGESDEILINAAIQYEWSAYQGGTVQLLEGNFYIATPIIITYSNIELQGVGWGSIVNNPIVGFGLLIYGTAGNYINRTKLTNIRIHGTSSGGGTVGTKLEYCNKCVVNNVNFSGSYVSGCYFNYCVSCQYTNNTIDGTSSAVGIFLESGSKNTITNNTSDGIGTGVNLNSSESYDIISNNSFVNGGQGILIGSNSCISISVTSNYCYNNGSDAGVANTNGRNYSDAGTSTQCFSNSWQSSTGTKEVTYTPTLQGFGTSPVVNNFTWVKLGNRNFFNGKITAGAVPSATEARIYLPPGQVSDSSILPTIQLAGHWGQNQVGVAYHVVLAEASVSYVTFGFQGGTAAALTKQNGNAIFGAVTIASFKFDIPILGQNF
jgi:hypothetical protein